MRIYRFLGSFGIVALLVASSGLRAQPVPSERVASESEVDPPGFDLAAALAEAKEKQIPEGDLQGWLAFKRDEFANQHGFGSPPPIPFPDPGPGPSPSPRPTLELCPNGNFEFGALTYWQPLAGSHPSGGLLLSPSAVIPGRHTILTGAGFDPNVGGSTLPWVNTGKYSVRLGNALGGAEAEGLEYQIAVTPQNQRLTFSYALVLEDAGHPPADQPFFQYEIRDPTGAVIKAVRRVADRNDPYFKTGEGGAIVYKNWDCESVDLSAYLGQVVTLRFITADCAPGGHFGYAYIDSVCSSDVTPSFTLPAEVCQGQTVLADGTASTNERDYFWSIEESDANGGRNPATEVYRWFLYDQAGVIDLSAFYASFGRSFQCDKYYRVKLAVKNGCVDWREKVKLLHVLCSPTANAGPDKVLCCTDPGVTIGTPAVPGVRFYSWTSDPPGFSSDGAMPPVPSQCARYKLTVTAANGCTATATTKVTVDKPFDLAVSEDDTPTSCSVPATLLAKVADKSSLCPANAGASCPQNPQVSFAWSTGSSEAKIGINPAVPSLYSVTATNACGSRTVGTVVQPCPALTGGFPPLIYPNAFTPNGDGKNDHFIIYQLGIAAGDVPAYNANEWEFIVFDRWGGEIAHRHGGPYARCHGMPNGILPNWDGRADGARSILPQGVYTWRLRLKNCSTVDWQEVKIDSVTIVGSTVYGPRR